MSRAKTIEDHVNFYGFEKFPRCNASTWRRGHVVLPSVAELIASTMTPRNVVAKCSGMLHEQR